MGQNTLKYPFQNEHWLNGRSDLNPGGKSLVWNHIFEEHLFLHVLPALTGVLKNVLKVKELEKWNFGHPKSDSNTQYSILQYPNTFNDWSNSYSSRVLIQV